MDKVIKMLISLLGLMVLVAADSDKPAATLIPANAAQGSYISLLSGKVGLSEKDIEDMWTEDSATVDPDLPLEVLPPALPKLPTISLAATGERKYSGMHFIESLLLPQGADKLSQLSSRRSLLFTKTLRHQWQRWMSCWRNTRAKPSICSCCLRWLYLDTSLTSPSKHGTALHP